MYLWLFQQSTFGALARARLLSWNVEASLVKMSSKPHCFSPQQLWNRILQCEPVKIVSSNALFLSNALKLTYMLMLVFSYLMLNINSSMIPLSMNPCKVSTCSVWIAIHSIFVLFVLISDTWPVPVPVRQPMCTVSQSKIQSTSMCNNNKWVNK